MRCLARDGRASSALTRDRSREARRLSAAAATASRRAELPSPARRGRVDGVARDAIAATPSDDVLRVPELVVDGTSARHLDVPQQLLPI